MIRDEQAGTLDTGNTQAVCVEPRSQDGVPRVHADGVSPTLNTAGGGGSGSHASSIGGQVNSYGFKGMMGAKAKGIAFEAEKSPTLNLSESQVLVERKEAKE